jgi:hypothetical protein
VREEIEGYIASQPSAKGEELRALHGRFLAIAPGAELWFLDGRNEDGKVVSNPNIGYGSQTIAYADGSRRDFYRIGLSANTAGLSVYVMGLENRTWLARTCGARLGKAKVTGYCIRFRSVKDIDLAVLEEIVAGVLGPRL